LRLIFDNHTKGQENFIHSFISQILLFLIIFNVIWGDYLSCEISKYSQAKARLR